MIQTQITINNKLGLHARASAKFVKVTNKFSSSIQVSNQQKTVNGKSIMGIMLLAATKGTVLNVTIDGQDEAQLLSQLKELVINNFNEPD